MVPKRRIITACMGLLSLLVLLKIFHIYVFLNPVVKIGPTASHRWSNEKSYANLMWMIQISDIHLSAYRDQSRMKNFYEFCNTTLDAIKPSVVLASGGSLTLTPQSSSEIVFELKRHTHTTVEEVQVVKPIREYFRCLRER